jgi:hypothetical protein
MRLVLYVSKGAHAALEEDAVRRSRAAGLTVSVEATARAILYQGMGVSPDGASTGGGGVRAPLDPQEVARLKNLVALMMGDDLPADERRANLRELFDFLGRV